MPHNYIAEYIVAGLQFEFQSILTPTTFRLQGISQSCLILPTAIQFHFQSTQ